MGKILDKWNLEEDFIITKYEVYKEVKYEVYNNGISCDFKEEDVRNTYNYEEEDIVHILDVIRYYLRYYSYL